MISGKLNNDISSIAEWILKIRKTYLGLISFEFPNIDDQLRLLVLRIHLTVTIDDLVRKFNFD